MNVDKHLETYLGPIVRGWSDGTTVQVCFFADCPSTGVASYGTLGLSNHVLKMSDSRGVRQELFLAVYDKQTDDSLAKLLAHVAAPLVLEHRALLAGEVVHLGSAITQGSQCRHLYAAIPVAFPDGFAVFGETRPATVMVWLIPITDAEDEMIRTAGWSAFEDILERSNTNLFDLGRASIV